MLTRSDGWAVLGDPHALQFIVETQWQKALVFPEVDAPTPDPASSAWAGPSILVVFPSSFAYFSHFSSFQHSVLSALAPFHFLSPFGGKLPLLLQTPFNFSSAVNLAWNLHGISSLCDPRVSSYSVVASLRWYICIFISCSLPWCAGTTLFSVSYPSFYRNIWHTESTSKCKVITLQGDEQEQIT